MTDSEFLDIASGEFLTENYPSEAVLWCKQSRAEYCEDFRLEDYKSLTGWQIAQNIEDMAEQLKAVYLRGLQDGKGKTMNNLETIKDILALACTIAIMGLIYVAL